MRRYVGIYEFQFFRFCCTVLWKSLFCQGCKCETKNSWNWPYCLSILPSRKIIFISNFTQWWAKFRQKSVILGSKKVFDIFSNMSGLALKGDCKVNIFSKTLILTFEVGTTRTHIIYCTIFPFLVHCAAGCDPPS